MVYIDSNIPMYVAGREHPNREAAVRFLARVRSREIEACTSSQVLQEILYRYECIQRRDLAARVYDLFAEICPAILAVTLADTDRARQMLTTIDGITIRQALHAAIMTNNGIERIATYDPAFILLPGVRRYELL